jgi:hypothetical protein
MDLLPAHTRSILEEVRERAKKQNRREKDATCVRFNRNQLKSSQLVYTCIAQLFGRPKSLPSKLHHPRVFARRWRQCTSFNAAAYWAAVSLLDGSKIAPLYDYIRAWGLEAEAEFLQLPPAPRKECRRMGKLSRTKARMLAADIVSTGKRAWEGAETPSTEDLDKASEEAYDRWYKPRTLDEIGRDFSELERYTHRLLSRADRKERKSSLPTSPADANREDTPMVLVDPTQLLREVSFNKSLKPCSTTSLDSLTTSIRNEDNQVPLPSKTDKQMDVLPSDPLEAYKVAERMMLGTASLRDSHDPAYQKWKGDMSMLRAHTMLYKAKHHKRRAASAISRNWNGPLDWQGTRAQLMLTGNDNDNTELALQFAEERTRNREDKRVSHHLIRDEIQRNEELRLPWGETLKAYIPHIKTLPFVEPGSKIRVASVHPTHMTHVSRALVPDVLKRLCKVPACHAILTGKDPKIRPHKDTKQLYSADLSKATDNFLHGAAQAVVRGMSSACSWNRKQSECAQKLVGAMYHPEKGWTKRGIHMGLGLSWTVLSVLNLWSANPDAQSVLEDRSFAVCGDDLAAGWTPEQRDSYKRRMAFVGGEMNDKKSYIGKRGVFCEATSRTKRGWVIFKLPIQLRILTMQRANHKFGNALRRSRGCPTDSPTDMSDSWALAYTQSCNAPTGLKSLFGLYRGRCPFNEKQLKMLSGKGAYSPSRLWYEEQNHKPTPRVKTDQFTRVYQARLASSIAKVNQLPTTSKGVPKEDVRVALTIATRVTIQRDGKVKTEMSQAGTRRLKKWADGLSRQKAELLLPWLNDRLLKRNGPVRSLTSIPKPRSKRWKRVWRSLHKWKPAEFISPDDALDALAGHHLPAMYSLKTLEECEGLCESRWSKLISVPEAE